MALIPFSLPRLLRPTFSLSILSFSTHLPPQLPLFNKPEEKKNTIALLNQPPNWSKTIQALFDAGDIDQALHLLDQFRLNGFRPTSPILFSLIDSLCNSHRFREAHHRLLFALHSNWLPDERACNSLLVRLCEASSPFDTRKIMTQMVISKPGFVPSLSNYNRLMSLFCDHRMPHEARELFMALERHGHCPNTVSYTALINGFCKIGEMDVAYKLFDEMKEREIRPNSLTYSVLLSGVLQKGKLDEIGRELMGRLWKQMAIDVERDPSINTAAFANLVEALCREGFFSEVYNIAEEMPHGKHVNADFSYTQMIDSLSRADQNHGASRITYIMKKRGLLPSFVSYNSIVHGLSKQGSIMRAYQLFEEGIEFDYTPIEPTYKVLVEGLCKVKDVAKARSVVDVMLKKSNLEESRVYNIFLRALCSINNPSELLNVLVSMLQSGCKPDVVTLNTVVHGFCEAGRVDEAMKVLDDMVKGNVCVPDVVTFTTVICGLSDMGRTDEALELLQNMPKRGFEPTTVTYNAIFRGLCKFSKIDEAMQLFAKMMREKVQADGTTFAILIAGLCNMGQIEEAKRFWEAVVWPSKVSDDFVYAAILKGMCKVGKFSEAINFLYELVDSGVSPKLVAYNILINSACNLGLKREAYRLISEMRKNGLEPDAVTWRTLDKLHGRLRRNNSSSFVDNGFSRKETDSELQLEKARVHSLTEDKEQSCDEGSSSDSAEEIPDPSLSAVVEKDIGEDLEIEEEACEETGVQIEEHTQQSPLEEHKYLNEDANIESLEGIDESFFHEVSKEEIRNGLDIEKRINVEPGKREPLSKVARRVFGLL
ncbi:hypothetical protein AMTRI_Chr04g188880 [Amborella trichopoda]